MVCIKTPTQLRLRGAPNKFVDTEIKPSDSGSLVVDATSHVIYGHVVGTNPLGEVYISPYSRILEQIQRQFPWTAVHLLRPTPQIPSSGSTSQRNETVTGKEKNIEQRADQKHATKRPETKLTKEDDIATDKYRFWTRSSRAPERRELPRGEASNFTRGSPRNFWDLVEPTSGMTRISQMSAGLATTSGEVLRLAPSIAYDATPAPVASLSQLHQHYHQPTFPLETKESYALLPPRKLTEEELAKIHRRIARRENDEDL